MTSWAIALPACPNATACSGWSRSHTAAAATARRIGIDDAAGRAVVDDVERPAGVGRRDHRLAGEERLVRPEAEVLVDRRVVGGEARGVEVGQLRRVDASREADPAVDATVGRELPQPVAVRPLADDDDLERGLERGCLDQQVDALGAIEPVDREDEVPVAVVVVGELLPGMGQHLGDEPRRALQPAGDVAGGREQAARLAERDAVEILHLAANGPVLGALGELPQRGAVELVGLPELVHEPDPLLGVAHDVRRELRRDDHVDRPPVALGEVEQAPRERLGQDLGARVPLERDRDDLRLVSPRAQLLDQRVGEDLGAPVGEGHLRPAHGNAHRGYPFSLRNAASSACNLSTCSWRSSTSRSAAALNERWSYASGSTYHRISLRSTALTGVPRPPRTPGRRRSERSAETGQSRSASSRAARRSAGSPPPAGSAPESRTCSRRLWKSASTSTGAR